jgi:hypothetical protein
MVDPFINTAVVERIDGIISYCKKLVELRDQILLKTARIFLAAACERKAAN